MSREKEPFTIYVDRLKEGKEELLNGIVPPDFLEIEESELKFREAVEFEGKATFSQGALILNLEVKTRFEMPCAICNDFASHPLHLPCIGIFAEAEDYKSGLFFFDTPLREAILLEIPQFCRCGGERCKREEEVFQFAKKGEGEQTSPFDGLTN